MTETTDAALRDSGVEDVQRSYELPDNLYIPPDALIVILEAFEGPLDLLLHLIRRKNLDILDIPVAEVTDQYMAYIDIMTTLRLELAGDYLVMAATLAELKSRMLLPRRSEENEEDDPRAELARRLLEYEVFQQAAERMDELPRLERDVFSATLTRPEGGLQIEHPRVELRELLAAFAEVLDRLELRRSHTVETESLSVRERMSELLNTLTKSKGYVAFFDLFSHSEHRAGVVVTLLALLELLRDGLVSVIQHGAYQPIYVARASESS